MLASFPEPNEPVHSLQVSSRPRARGYGGCNHYVRTGFEDGDFGKGRKLDSLVFTTLASGRPAVH